ncbi:MAG: hypothetical protein H7Y60_08140 [Rhodospirillaceae bacterium]|nr:hypothetical protein [Rhodospirillales bacterium]
MIEAVKWSSLERVRLLLDYGATVDRHLYRGQSIFDIAEERVTAGRKDASEILVTCSGTLIRLKVEPWPKLRRRARFGQWGQDWSPERAEILAPLP